MRKVRHTQAAALCRCVALSRVRPPKSLTILLDESTIEGTGDGRFTKNIVYKEVFRRGGGDVNDEADIPVRLLGALPQIAQDREVGTPGGAVSPDASNENARGSQDTLVELYDAAFGGDYERFIKHARVAETDDGKTDMWLHTEHIDAAMMLISWKTGQDFQSATIATNRAGAFTYKLVLPRFANAMQIILVEGKHWIAIRRRDTFVEVADSRRGRAVQKMYDDAVTRSVQLFGTKPVKWVQCPMQTHPYDCGVFAIACAFEWACGSEDLVNPAFDSDSTKMRHHLNYCYANAFLRHFPLPPFRFRQPRPAVVSRCAAALR